MEDLSKKEALIIFQDLVKKAAAVGPLDAVMPVLTMKNRYDAVKSEQRAMMAGQANTVSRT